MQSISVLCLILAVGSAGAASPVQKVVELLGECKAKVEKDLAAETAAMTEYTKYCDDNAKEKGYAIETATRSIEDCTAVVEDSTATIAKSDDEIATLGTSVAGKEKELSSAVDIRAAQHADFQAAEKELVESIDQLGRAAAAIKKGTSFAQTRGGRTTFSAKSQKALDALKTIIDAEWVDAGSRKTLKSFIQAQASAAAAADDDLSLDQPQAKTVAYESGSGAIVQMVEDMQGKAEDTLSNLRKKETEGSHEFQMVEQGLKDEIANTNDKLATATKAKAEATQRLEEKKGELVETEKNKAADEEFLASLKAECQTRATEFEERMKSGKDEIGAISKASEILESGVTAFVQVSTKIRVRRADDVFSNDDDDDASNARSQVVDILKKIADQRHSYVFAQVANMAASDPFEKIRGLINDMIEKLLKEAQAEATHEAFCKEEVGKSKTSQEDKQSKLDKFSARVDETDAQLGQLTESIKTLQAEVGEIDKAQAEATKLRTAEHDEFLKVSKDFKDSATAVAQAIEVLQQFYGGASFVQVSSKTSLKSHMKARSSSEGNGDAAGVIIGVLEVAQEDFTNLLAEAEGEESEAQAAFDKMTTENKVGKASKLAEAKAKESQVKGLSSQQEMNKEDLQSTGKELDAVNAYLDKLKPECESKGMSYEEKKAARDSEIEGLKEALSILEGKGVALLQKGTRLKRIHRA